MTRSVRTTNGLGDHPDLRRADLPSGQCRGGVGQHRRKDLTGHRAADGELAGVGDASAASVGARFNMPARSCLVSRNPAVAAMARDSSSATVSSITECVTP